MQMRNLPVFIVAVLCLSSCFKEEEMVPPHEQGDLETGQAPMGVTYANQVYFDLHQNTVASANLISGWDLSFESVPDGWTVRLNSSKFMLAGNTHTTHFGAEINREALDMRFDSSDGNPDSTAFGNWYLSEGDSAWSLKEVFLVDRGMDEKDKPVGLKKVQLEIQGNGYLVRYSNLDHSGDTTVLIRRDPLLDRIYFSFEKGVVDMAPLPGTWSLLFSKYTTMLVTNEGENYPYIVAGVLLNPNGVSATLDTIHDFHEIGLADTIDLELTSRADVIGYEWKYYNFDAGVYTIEPGLSYVIRDRNGLYYKMRFIDFYNDIGEKGYPSFEFVRL